MDVLDPLYVVHAYFACLLDVVFVSERLVQPCTQVFHNFTFSHSVLAYVDNFWEKFSWTEDDKVSFLCIHFKSDFVHLDVNITYTILKVWDGILFQNCVSYTEVVF